MFQWMVQNKIMTVRTSVKSSLMPMWEGHLTEVHSKTMIVIPTILTINMISVFKIWVFGGICLSLFADSLLFDHMLKTSFHDGVDSPQDLIDRDMSLGVVFCRVDQNWSQPFNWFLVIWPYTQWLVNDMRVSDYEPYRILGMLIKCILIFHW